MIQAKEKLCKCGCGKVGRLFSKGLILECWKREYMKNKKVVSRVAIKKVSEKQKIKNEENKLETKKMHEWFLQLWDKTEVNGYCFCFETGAKMHRSIYRNNSCCYHHILEKGTDRYEKYKFEEWNVVIVLPSIHTQAHGINIPPRIKKLTEELKNKY